MYNPRLMALLANLNAGYSNMNTQRIHNNFVDDPKVYGFEMATQCANREEEVVGV
jgi:hypothetical protein